MAAVVPPRPDARLTVPICHFGAERIGTRVEAADDRAGALAASPGPQRASAASAALVSALEDLVQQRAVERQAAVEGAAIGQNLLCISVSHHPLLHQPLVVGVVEPVHHPEQTPISALILIAVVCAAVAPGGPAALPHVAFAVYVAAVYVRNRGAAAFVCPAGWTWVQEVLARSVVVLSARVRV